MEPLDVTIRVIRGGEIAQALNLAWLVFEEFEAPEYTPEGVETFQRYLMEELQRERTETGEYEIWGAIDARGEVVGVAAARLPDHICLLFVDKRYHRKGIARQLVYAMVSWVLEAGADRLEVNSSPYAVPAYRKLGFRPTGPEVVRDGMRFTPMQAVL